MPTENRSSNTEMVSVPRELLERLDLGKNTATALSALPELRAILALPAEQSQGEPVALPARKDPKRQWHVVGGVARAEGWNACLDEIAKLGPLYTRADPGEVERLTEELSIARDEDLKWQGLRDQEREIGELRAQLGERDALLREIHDGALSGFERYSKIEALLSASAEPIAPIAWHVGGNGYDRICFEEPADLPGHPCIQPVHDHRQLIELLKRYDLRDEDVPPDERAHGIPGTSFQRLNALANQGE